MIFGFVGFLPLLVVAVLLIALFSGRSEPDPDRERPTALYLSIASFVAVLFVLGATFAVSTGLANLTDSSSGGGWFAYSEEGSIDTSQGDYAPIPSEFEPATTIPNYDEVISESRGNFNANHDDDVSMIVLGLIFGVLAVAVHRFHFPPLQRLAKSSSGPGATVFARYVYAVAFVAMLAAVVTTGIVAFAICQAIAPDTFGVDSIAEALRMLGANAAFAIVALLIFRYHWRQAPVGASERPIGFAPPPSEPAKRAPAKKAAATKKASPPSR